MIPADGSGRIDVMFSDHVVSTKKTVPAGSGSGRVIRVFFIDAEATDSSSSDEECGGLRRRVKRHVNEIRIEEAAPTQRRRRRKVKAEKRPGEAGEQGRRFRGVRQRPWGRWVAEIRDPNQRKRLWLGTFHSAEEAAAAYDEAAVRLKGTKAVTNFPERATSLPPKSDGTAACTWSSATSVLQYGKDWATPVEFLDLGLEELGGQAPPFSLPYPYDCYWPSLRPCEVEFSDLDPDDFC